MQNTQQKNTAGNAGTVNDQITDSVSQTNTMLIGSAASEARSLLDLVSAETLGMSMHNAVTAQQNAQMSTNASVTASCARMLQAQPIPETPDPKPVTPPVVPPPFMPLDDTKTPVQTAENLIKEAEKMMLEAKAIMSKVNEGQSKNDEAAKDAVKGAAKANDKNIEKKKGGK